MTRKKYLEGNLLTITPESCDRSFSTSARASRILASIPALATPATRFGDNSWTSRAILQMTVLHHTDWCILIFIKNTFTTFQFHSTEKKKQGKGASATMNINFPFFDAIGSVCRSWTKTVPINHKKGQTKTNESWGWGGQQSIATAV